MELNLKVAMIGLPTRLEKIAGLQQSISADDITLSVTGRGDGYIEVLLQDAELLLLTPRRGGKEKPNIELFAQGHCIPKVESLGIQADGKNNKMIQALGGTAYQVAPVIARISHRNYGMKEGNLMRLVQACVMSRLAYLVPFMRLSAAEKSKLERLESIQASPRPARLDAKRGPAGSQYQLRTHRGSKNGWNG